MLHIDWAARHARRVLGPHRVLPGIVAVNQTATVEYHPLGVIGVVGPWNYPVFTPMGSIVYALAAGNAVIFKSSELTPAVGEWLVRSFGDVAGRGSPQPVLQLLTGAGETVAALAAREVDKIAFTGSAATARKVMAVAAENLTPVIAECGGKDALIVDADADLNAAADAAAWARCRTPARPASALSGCTWPTRCTRRSWPSWRTGSHGCGRAVTTARTTAR